MPDYGDLRYLARFEDTLTSLSLSGGRCDGYHLRELGNLSHLRLNLDAHVDLRHVAALPNLRRLTLGGPDAGSYDLSPLQSAASLTVTVTGLGVRRFGGADLGVAAAEPAVPPQRLGEPQTTALSAWVHQWRGR